MRWDSGMQVGERHLEAATGGGDSFVYEDMVDALRKSFTFFIHM